MESIDVNRCTHITYAFIGLNEDGTVRILDDWNEIQRGALRRFVALKQKRPALKTLISMGGWDEGSARYSRVVNNAQKRATLVNSVANFVNQHGFDGFDFDWEYPAKREGIPQDYVTYITFLRELRARFGTSKLITVAVGADPSMIGTSYNVPAMNQVLDYINLMTYDYNSHWLGRTGQNSPLFASPNDANRNFNIDASVNAWIRAGANPQKLFLGLGFYAQTFRLANPAQNGIGAPTAGPGNPGTWSRQGGLLMYLEICLALNQGGWTVRFDTQQQSPYAFKGNQWMGYDNPQSIRIKTQYAVQKNLAGVMMWSIDYEDRHNRCGTGYNPLLSAIAQVIRI